MTIVFFDSDCTRFTVQDEVHNYIYLCHVKMDATYKELKSIAKSGEELDR